MKLDEIKARLRAKFADEYKMSGEAARAYSTEDLMSELEGYSKDLRAQFATTQVWDCSYMSGCEENWNAGRTSKELHANECPVSYSELCERLDLDWEIDVAANVWCNAIRDELASRFSREFSHDQLGYDS